MSGGRVSIAVGMQLTALVALDLAILRGGAEILRSPVVLCLFCALNVALAQTVLLRRPLRGSHIAFMIVGGACSIAIAALLTMSRFGPGRVWWVATGSGLSVAWAASLLAARHTRGQVQGFNGQARRSPVRFDVMSLLAATALGLLITGAVLRSLSADLGHLGQLVLGAPKFRGRTINEMWVQEPGLSWALTDASSEHVLRARTASELVEDPSLAWSLGGSGFTLCLREITLRWALFDPQGPGLAARIAVDLIAMSPFLMIVGAAVLVLRLLDPGPSWREMCRQPGFWASVTPVLILLSMPLVGTLFAIRLSPPLISGAVGVAWLSLAISRRWKSEPSWLDRTGRVLGFGWLAILVLSAWAIQWGLLIL